MQSDDFGRFFRIIKIAIHSIANHSPEFFQRVTLGIDPETQCRSTIPPLFRFCDFKNDFRTHAFKMTPGK